MNRGAQGMDTILLSDHRGRMSIFLETVTVATAIACGLVHAAAARPAAQS